MKTKFGPFYGPLKIRVKSAQSIIIACFFRDDPSLVCMLRQISPATATTEPSTDCMSTTNSSSEDESKCLFKRIRQS